MAQSGAEITAIVTDRSGATATREVIVKELCDDCLVDASKAQSAAVNPRGKVGDAAQAARERIRSVAAVGQILLECINVRREGPFGEHIDDVATSCEWFSRLATTRRNGVSEGFCRVHGADVVSRVGPLQFSTSLV